MTQDTTTTGGWNDLFKVITDYAKDAANAYHDVYSAFNPEEDTPSVTQISQADYTPWMIGGSVLLAIIVLVLVFKK